MYEEIFQCTYYCKLSFFEVRAIPIRLRKWYIQRVQKAIDDENKAREKQSKMPG